MNVMRSVMCVAMVASFLSAQTSLLEGRSLDDWSSESGGWEWLGDALRGDIPEGQNEIDLSWTLGGLDDFDLTLRYSASDDAFLLLNLAPHVSDGRGRFNVTFEHGWREFVVRCRDGKIRGEGKHGDRVRVVGFEGRRVSGPALRFRFKGPAGSSVVIDKIDLKRLPLEGRRKIVMVAGPMSHGYGAHEHKAGCELLARRLNVADSGLLAVVYSGGWPADPSAFDNANAVVLYANGGVHHPANAHLDELRGWMERGVGVACLHYGVEVPIGEGGDVFREMIGGYFETHWSVNPHWTAHFEALPEHDVTQGVEPFSLHDEWYYNMRFRDEMKGVSPVLTAVPPDKTRERPDGPHSNNPYVRSRRGAREHVAWVAEREDGGRGFGCTGGHFHWSWGHDQFRRLVLNSLVWVAGADVPAGGFVSETPSVGELMRDQDEEIPVSFDPEKLEAELKSWNDG